MKKKSKKAAAKDMPELSFKQGVRAKYLDRLPLMNHSVTLSKDVAEIFPDSASVNDALRAVATIIRSRGIGAKHRAGSL